MKTTLSLLLCLIGMWSAPLAFAETYDVLHRQHQQEDKGRGVEESNIYVIRCSAKPDETYYIYQYFRGAGRPNFRAISPPQWGTPLGGKDHDSFEEAACAACGRTAETPHPGTGEAASAPDEGDAPTSIILD